MNLMQVPVFNHRVEITRGILEQECSDMLKDFFENLRSSKKRQKESAGDSGTD
jgi:tRNA(adenine34) deaminase